MFERAHHQRVALVLQALQAEQLAARGCLFGGGTAIALRYGEFRESLDIYFVVADPEGYRELRQLLTGVDGLKLLWREGMAIEQSREVRADQYGIRTFVRVGDTNVKFEIVREARIPLDAPGADDRVCGVATLTLRDLVASKLLANADRWPDDAVYSRDLIDLAMMRPARQLVLDALVKAEAAYGDSARRDLARAIQQLRDRPRRLEECMRAMRIDGVSPAQLWEAIRKLERAAR